MRFPHYLKQNKSSVYPRHCIWFDTETTPEQISPDTIKHNLNFGWACYRRRSRGDKWSKPHWYRFTTINQFWHWVTETIDTKESFTLFAHNGSFDLPVLDAFNWLQDDGWNLTNAVIDSPPIILKWRKDGKTIRFIDTLNIWRMPLAAIGKSIGLDKLPFPDDNATPEYWDTYGKRDTEIIMLAIIKWFDFIKQHDLGGFAPTLASQAVRAYRHRFMNNKILIDDNETALNMARDAYHGGRTECFHIGEVTGPLYQLDVNSMYPDVMKKELMPTCLIGVFKRVKHLELYKLMKDCSVIAQVTLSVDTPVFPQFKNGKLIFPVGDFETTLTTPELIYALDNGYVTNINQVAIYKQAIIFSEFVTYLYDLRQRAKNNNETTTAQMAKILMNSLYGKFGQQGRVYETIDNNDSKEIKTWTEIDADTNEVIHHRQFAGMVQQLTTEPESRDSHPAIAAHVTAYARMNLWNIYQTAGLDNCYYSDTDCVVVNQSGYDNLQPLIDPNLLGFLKLEQIIQRASIRGPKDYTFDDVQKVKGVKRTAEWLDTNTVRQEQWAGLRGLLAKGDLTAPTTKTITKRLKRIYTKGDVMKSGRVKPYRLG